MYVSPEMITMILTGVGTVAAVLGVGLAVYRHSQARLDRRFEQVEDRLGSRIDRIDSRIDRVESRIDRIEVTLNGVAEDVVELKVSVARLEGPQPTLLRAR